MIKGSTNWIDSRRIIEVNRIVSNNSLKVCTLPLGPQLTNNTLRLKVIYNKIDLVCDLIPIATQQFQVIIIAMTNFILG